MLYFIIFYLIFIFVWKMYLQYKIGKTKEIKKMIWDRGLYYSIMKFEEYIEKDCRYYNQWKKPYFFAEVLKYTRHLEEFILRPVNLHQIYNWDIQQCFSVLKFIRKGIRLDDSAQMAQERLSAGNTSSMLIDERTINEESQKFIKVLSEPALMEIVLNISIMTENRLEFLMDRLYNEALNSGDFETAMEVRISKAWCFYALLDIWSNNEFTEELYSFNDEAEVLKLTGRIADYGYMSNKYKDIVSKKQYKKYFN